jgi:hypothetical protein
MKPRRVEVHIEELVLHGLAATDRHNVGDAVVAELERLLAEQGLPEGIESSILVERLAGAAIEVRPGMPAASVGVAVAGSLYTSLQNLARGRS